MQNYLLHGGEKGSGRSVSVDLGGGDHFAVHFPGGLRGRPWRALCSIGGRRPFKRSSVTLRPADAFPGRLPLLWERDSAGSVGTSPGDDAVAGLVSEAPPASVGRLDRLLPGLVWAPSNREPPAHGPVRCPDGGDRGVVGGADSFRGRFGASGDAPGKPPGRSHLEALVRRASICHTRLGRRDGGGRPLRPLPWQRASREPGSDVDSGCGRGRDRGRAPRALRGGAERARF